MFPKNNFNEIFLKIKYAVDKTFKSSKRNTNAKEFKGKETKFKYQRIKIKTYFNGKGPLLIKTPFRFSFGVNEKESQESDKIVGYSIPVCLWSKESQPTSEESMFFNGLNDYTNYVNMILKNNLVLMWQVNYLHHYISNK